jgi:hypothetical protein
MSSDAGEVVVRRLWQRRAEVLFVATLGLLLAGVGFTGVGIGRTALALWVAATLLGLFYSTTSLAAAMLRRQPSVDVIAWLALVGALWVGRRSPVR